MKTSSIGLVLAFVCCVAIVWAEVGSRKPNNKKDYKFKDSDLKQAKARWISLEDEDWGDDMMQKPIDEPPRRVWPRSLLKFTL